MKTFSQAKRQRQFIILGTLFLTILGLFISTFVFVVGVVLSILGVVSYADDFTTMINRDGHAAYGYTKEGEIIFAP